MSKHKPFHTIPSWNDRWPGSPRSLVCNTFLNFSGPPKVKFYIFWVETFKVNQQKIITSTYSYLITMAPWHTPTLAENHQNGSFWTIFEFPGKAYPYSASKHSSILENSQNVPWYPEMGPRALIGFELHGKPVLLTILPREERTKEEKVRYKSLRTASRPLKEVLGYLEGSDYVYIIQ